MVQFKMLSFVSASVFVASVAAQLRIACYTGAQYDCSRFINQFCNHATSNTYNPYDNLNRCFNNGQGGKCDLTVWLRDPTRNNQTPSNANCRRALNTAMESCPSGGIGQFADHPFQFGIDANGGKCSGDVGNGNRLTNTSEVNVSSE